MAAAQPKNAKLRNSLQLCHSMKYHMQILTRMNARLDSFHKVVTLQARGGESQRSCRVYALLIVCTVSEVCLYLSSA